MFFQHMIFVRKMYKPMNEWTLHEFHYNLLHGKFVVKGLHQNIWIKMLHAYCFVLNPSVENINAQPYALMNEVKGRLDDNSEYISYDLAYREFKASLNVYLKNKQHSLKLLLESEGARPSNCPKEHLENMRRFITS